MSGDVIMMPPGADLFMSGAEALVNPVDCTGAQGKGLAKLFANHFPEACRAYRSYARLGQMTPGQVWMKSSPLELGRSALWIYFIATKDHWRNDSKLEWIEAGLRGLRTRVGPWVSSIAIPALGCSLGGLAWDDVRPLIETEGRLMADAGIVVRVYPPHERGRARR